MSASKPETRTEFREYCLRQLGKPVIQINVAPPQVEDLIDEAIEFFHRNHYDGVINQYLPVTVTERVLRDKFVEVDPSIISVNTLLESGLNSTSMFSVEWQMIAQAYPFSLQGGNLLTYDMAMSYREMLKMTLTGKTKPIRFNRHMNRLYIDTNWATVKEGQTFVADVFRTLDPDEFPNVWNDPFLKEYATNLIKRQWGNNLRKLRNVQLVGGVSIDGAEILQEAEARIKELKDECLLEHQEPIGFTMG